MFSASAFCTVESGSQKEIYLDQKHIQVLDPAFRTAENEKRMQTKIAKIKNQSSDFYILHYGKQK